MTEKQLKAQNKVKLISCIILIVGLLLILLWSMKKNEKPKTPVDNSNTIAIQSAAGTYEYKCINNGCALFAQGGLYAIVNDGSYHLVNLSDKTDKEIKLPTMAKGFMVAGNEFYGLVYTKGETNTGTFYEVSKDRSLFDDELNYEAMDKENVRDSLVRLYQKGYFYVMKESTGQLYDINNSTVVLENVVGCVADDAEIYVVSDKGVTSFGQDNALTSNLTNVKRAFASMYDHKFVVLDTDGNLKLATLAGEVGESILEVGNRNVQSVSVTDNILKVVVEDEEFSTNQKVHNYEYDFSTKQLKTID